MKMSEILTEGMLQDDVSDILEKMWEEIEEITGHELDDFTKNETKLDVNLWKNKKPSIDAWLAKGGVKKGSEKYKDVMDGIAASFEEICEIPDNFDASK